MSNHDDEDAQSLHYAKTHYVDRLTVEDKGDVKFDLSSLTKKPNGRYWMSSTNEVKRETPELKPKVEVKPQLSTPLKENKPNLATAMKPTKKKQRKRNKKKNAEAVNQLLGQPPIPPVPRNFNNIRFLGPPIPNNPFPPPFRPAFNEMPTSSFPHQIKFPTNGPPMNHPNIGPRNMPPMFVPRFNSFINMPPIMRPQIGIPLMRPPIRHPNVRPNFTSNNRRIGAPPSNNNARGVTNMEDFFGAGKSTTSTPKKKDEPKKPVDVIDLDSSDDDSVMEIKAPEQSLIYVNSSDEEELCDVVTSPKPADEAEPRTSVSPIPSVVSSTSDDFIKQDCDDLKSDGKELEFNFSLHGTEYPTTPTKSVEKPNASEVFATPKSKKKKVKASNSYTMSDENYVMPFVDIYDSESSDFTDSIVDMPIADAGSLNPSQDNLFINVSQPNTTDLTIDIDDPRRDSNLTFDSEMLNSSVKQLLDPKGEIGMITPEKCLDDMNYFYNESWGGESFDHQKIKKQIPRSKDQWSVDLSDQCNIKRRKSTMCFYCKRFGHQEGKCPKRPRICCMCGENGHFDTKCPNKICLNCGNRNNSFSVKCQKCSLWAKLRCEICRLNGHPKDRCPDMWRRYHMTIKNEIPLVESNKSLSEDDCFCSGCGEKGHLQINCKTTASKFFKSSVLIQQYKPVYVPDGIQDSLKAPNEKRKSESASSGNNRNTPPKRKSDTQPDVGNNTTKKIKLNNIQTMGAPSKSMGEYPIRMPMSVLEFKNLYCNGGITFMTQLSKKLSVPFEFSEVSPGYILNISRAKNSDLFIRHMKQCEFRTKRAMPLTRIGVVIKLQDSLNALTTNIGDPVQLHKQVKILQKNRLRLMEHKAGDKALEIMSSRICTMFRKINMILVGQAGFLRGRECVTRLKTILHSLKSTKCERVDEPQHAEILKLYYQIFSMSACHDYHSLLQRYKSKTK